MEHLSVVQGSDAIFRETIHTRILDACPGVMVPMSGNVGRYMAIRSKIVKSGISPGFQEMNSGPWVTWSSNGERCSSVDSALS